MQKLARPLPAQRNRPDVLQKRVYYANWFKRHAVVNHSIFADERGSYNIWTAGQTLVPLRVSLKISFENFGNKFEIISFKSIYCKFFDSIVLKINFMLSKLSFIYLYVLKNYNRLYCLINELYKTTWILCTFWFDKNLWVLVPVNLLPLTMITLFYLSGRLLKQSFLLAMLNLSLFLG